MSALPVQRSCPSRCGRAAGASAVVLGWFLVVPYIVITVVGLAATLLADLVPTGVGDMVESAGLVAYFASIFVVPLVLLPSIVVALIVAIGAIHGDAVPGRGAVRVGTLSSALGLGVVGFVWCVVAGVVRFG